MKKQFNRVITFHVVGEIYDDKTTPESIIKRYNWSFKKSVKGDIIITATHKDNRGQINKLTKLPKTHKWKTSDNEFFLSIPNKKKI